MDWKLPPRIKIFEALGCVADGRIEVADNIAKVYSSNRDKYYTVIYDPETRAIMANDNGSYWQGYLGYPSLALLMVIGLVSYNPKASQELRGIAWKTLNTQFKNDFTMTERAVLDQVASQNGSIQIVLDAVETVMSQLLQQTFQRFGKRLRPPKNL